MRVAVLNGVNLDVLGRRDPALYGGLGLAELESRIYQWSKELECTTRCRQTNHEGQYVDADKLTANVKGPASEFQVELLFLRDADRTPLRAQIPVAIGKFTVEFTR